MTTCCDKEEKQADRYPSFDGVKKDTLVIDCVTNAFQRSGTDCCIEKVPRTAGMLRQQGNLTIHRCGTLSQRFIVFKGNSIAQKVYARRISANGGSSGKGKSRFITAVLRGESSTRSRL